MNLPSGPNQPFADFDSACSAVLGYLRQQLPFDLWMVSRVQEPNYLVLLAEDSGYGVASGMSLRWNDTLCSRMIRGAGPQVAQDCARVPSYASAPLQQALPAGAYLGVPIFLRDGELFGTLCALNRTAVQQDLQSMLPLVDLQARLLGSILGAELITSELARNAERAVTDASTDALTGLINRRAWDRVLNNEEMRCQRYGHSAFVISIDLDGLKAINDSQGHAAGDQLIRRAGKALRGAAREQDVVARLGGDEFAVLAIECDRVGGQALLKRLADALSRERILASIGHAMRLPLFGLSAAWEESDRAMYECKKQRKRQSVQTATRVS
jgi:diguanylate cyclase (GGDEF)-like protein